MHRAHWLSSIALSVTAATAVLASSSSVAFAAPQAHILRIDPTAGVASGAPELTTVIEIVQNNAMSDVLAPCNSLNGDAALDCQSTQMEKPGALFSAIKWPDGAATLTVTVDGDATPATFESQAQWGSSKVAGSNIGTAWLISLDASSGMGTRYEEARQIANEFINKMEANDLMDIQVFDDRNTIQNSGWQTFANRPKLQAILKAQASPAPSHGKDRALFTQIKGMINDAFGTLGNTGGPTNIPLHQAMVLLSDGSGRGDAESASPSADVFHQFLDGGRFPADNTLLPKTPLPVVSLYFPGGTGVVNDALRNNDQQFMQALGNPEIGGFYDIVRSNNLAAAEQKGTSIIGIVKKRFDEMYVVKWRLSCLNLSPTQTFSLFFTNTKPAISPDGSFKDVPIGVDPSQWPLDIDVAATQAEANKSALWPGGTFKVFGNFCWGGDKSRAEAYFVPAGTKPDPNANSADPATALKAMTALQQQGMRGTSTDASQTSVTYNVPDVDNLVEGTADNAVAHVIIYDNKAKRSSGRDAKSILTLKAGKKPINWLLLAGIFGGVLVVGLIIITMLRSGGGGGGGGGKKRKGGAPPPQPIVAGGGYGAPPGGGGGYGGPQGVGGGGAGYGPQGGGAYGPPGGGGGGGYGAAPAQPANAQMNAAAASGPINVICASCGNATMVQPGRPGICFTCGQPVSAAGAALGSTAKSGDAVQAYRPPPSPYAGPGQLATISGKNGHFTIHPGAEVRVGRDPAQCPVTLDDPRISAVHATLRFETPDLWARDETSNNGTFVQGARIQPNTWVPVPNRSQLRFGPIEFDVQVQAGA